MTLDLSKPVLTKTGQEARIYTTEGPGSFPVVGVYESALTPGYWSPGMWDTNGNYFTGDVGRELVNAKEEKTFELYLNLYRDVSGKVYGQVHSSPTIAK
jgi:hypothetical protein